MEPSPTLVEIRPVHASDAEALFPLIAGTSVADTLVSEAPASLDEYREGLARLEAQVVAGLSHFFTIVVGDSGRPVGSIALRPKGSSGCAEIGLWVGAGLQRHGYGARAIALAARYGFEQLSLERIEARIFVGNDASRRVFERAGFVFEALAVGAVVKRGVPRDEWVFALSRPR
jgi:RimJ/RimL family protein N-acetyltransferase